MARGLDNNDHKLFSKENIEKLKLASDDIYCLLGRGYKIESSVAFVGNHYALTTRQGKLLTRAVCSEESLELKKNKEVLGKDLEGKHIHIDGFNIIITLEVLISGGTSYISTDGCIRDLAGLRGSYRIIPQTTDAILQIASICEKFKVAGVHFYLDEPISNSGNLKTCIFDLAKAFKCDLTVDIVRNPDIVLYDKEYVVSTDTVILEKCKSWYNLNKAVAQKLNLSIPINLQLQ